MVSEADILRFVRSRRYRPMAAEGIAQHFGLAEEEMPELRKTIHEMELAGELIEVKYGCLTTPEKVGLMVGVLQCNPRGFGFVAPVREQDGQDVYIHGEDQGAAAHGDLVVISVSRGPRRPQRGPAGKVVRVVRHARQELVGTFRRERSVAYVEPDDPRYFRDVYVGEADARGARPGEKVQVRITAWPSRHLNPEGVIEEVLGPEGDPQVQTLAVIREYGLRTEFPKDALEAAGALAARVAASELEGRLDLREAVTFTIDPDDAKDFDDAISIRREAEGWELGVHIADVAHYVADLGPVDREAQARGTSVYLPGRTLPMLPEALSGDVCSLREHRVRLTRSVIMQFSSEGALQGYRIAPSAIRSRRRLTYGQVQDLFDGRAAWDDEPAEALLEARRLAAVLRERRLQRGMLELDIAEVRIAVDEKGQTECVEVVQRDEAHSLIEHFMLSANEVVAAHLARHRLPYVGRCHGEPSTRQLSEMRDALKAMGYSLGVPGTPKQIQKVIDRARGREEARAVNICILRCMCRAEYSPENRGHYALATAHYTHFTSPIRRYPDLVVHRILTEHERGLLDEKRREEWRERLGPWLLAATEAEHAADQAEQELTRRRLIEMLLREPDKGLEAIVTDVNDRGALVEITALALEGRISFRHLANDFYRLNSRRARLVGHKGRQLYVGQRLLVKVAEADPAHGEVFFAPCGGQER